MQEFFYIRGNNKYIQVRFSEIIYGEARGNFVKLICIGKNYLVPGGMKEVSNVLPKNFFCRVHRSYFISIERVKEFDKESLLLDNGTMLPIGRFYAKEFKERIRIVGRTYVHHRWMADGVVS